MEIIIISISRIVKTGYNDIGEIPVAIHYGDTGYSQTQLKYSHPLTVDEVAVEYRDINFVICHMGDPWIMDTAELISKNHNVFTDLSGFIAGNKAHVQKRMHTPLFLIHFQRDLVYFLSSIFAF